MGSIATANATTHLRNVFLHRVRRRGRIVAEKASAHRRQRCQSVTFIVPTSSHPSPYRAFLDAARRCACDAYAYHCVCATDPAPGRAFYTIATFVSAALDVVVAHVVPSRSTTFLPPTSIVATYTTGDTARKAVTVTRDLLRRVFNRAPSSTSRSTISVVVVAIVFFVRVIDFDEDGPL